MTIKVSIGPLVSDGLLDTSTMRSEMKLKPRTITLTWPLYGRGHGKKPPGGRLLRKARLRKKQRTSRISMTFKGWVNSLDLMESLPGDIQLHFTSQVFQ